MRTKLTAILFNIFFTAFIFSAMAQPKNVADIKSYSKLRQNTTFEMQSSYDRTEGNDDGFNGTYSILRIEDGNAVIAETEGKGMITRIWFPYNHGYPIQPMWLTDKRIYIYLDGADTPAIDLPVIELFNKANTNFPYPLCGMDLGGCWCQVPIAFNKGAKVVVEGEKVGFFQIQFTKIHDNRPWETFALETNPFATKKKELMAQLWNPGNVDYLDIEKPIVQENLYELKKGENSFQLLEGANILRAFIAEAEGINLPKFLEGSLEIYWDNQKSPAIDVPLSMFFIQENTGTHSKSLMAGLLPGGKGVYNFFPMPYKKRATVKINVSESCKVNLKFIYEKQDENNLEQTYLYTTHNVENPTEPGTKHLWLDVEGTGHYVGVYMRSEGESATWGEVYFTPVLEGDETFVVDGKMVAHGTGTEDYFNAGWNGEFMRLDHAKVMATHGYTLFDATAGTCRAASFRWHLQSDVIPFNKNIKGEIEVGPTDNLVGKYESIAYYYLQEK